MDTTEGELEADVDLSYFDHPPTLTDEEVALLAPLLPPGFGALLPMREAREPSAASLTQYSEKISVRVPRPILTLLKQAAEKRGMPYQTLINIVLAAYVTGGTLPPSGGGS